MLENRVHNKINHLIYLLNTLFQDEGSKVQGWYKDLPTL